MGLRNENSFFYDQLTKIDIANNQSTKWVQEACFPGEPIFIPSPDSKAEDEGILLSLVIDARKKESFLLILDASSMKEITRIVVDEPILAGFHGNYFKN